MREILAVEYHHIVLISIRRIFNTTMIVIYWWNFSYGKTCSFVASLSRVNYLKWENIIRVKLLFYFYFLK